MKPMLDVYLHGEPIGRIDQRADGLLSFRYGERALDEPARHALSVRLPVRARPYDHGATIAFFENLLPEGDGRDLVAHARHFSPDDVPGLLGAIGGECAGAVSLWPHGERPPETPAYRALSPDEMQALFGREYAARAMEVQVAGRVSMSGAQQKMVFRRRGTSLDLPLQGAAGNVIVKRARAAFPGLVLNELLCMRLLAAAGFEAAETRAFGGGALLLESVRYDRVDEIDGSIRRLHQEDLCQATGRRSSQKYQARGGPTYAEIARVIRGFSVDPLRDVETLARWALFNFIVGNNDGHAKNLSLLFASGEIGLAPVYDVVSTHVYPQIDRHFSIDLGGQKTAEAVHRGALEKFARALGIRAPALASVAQPMVEAIRASITEVAHDVEAAHGGDPVIGAIHDLVVDRVSTLERLLLQLTARIP